MAESENDSFSTVVFVLEKDAAEREAMRAVLAEAGYLALPVEQVAAALAIMQSGALCDLIVLSADAMDSTAQFDALVDVRQPAPPIIIYGMDPAAKIVLHCLNRGAIDFLPKPFGRDELLHAVENAVCKENEGPKKSDTIIASSPITDWIEITASSELEQFRRLQRFSDTLFSSRLPDKICEDLKMAVEEVGRNAVEWGNRFDPDKQVKVSYCIFDDRVVIKVEDEGEGFVPQNVPDPTADPMKTMQDRIDAGKRPGGYGVYLIKRLVDEIVYSEKGNTVLLIKYLPEEDAAEVDTAMPDVEIPVEDD